MLGRALTDRAGRPDPLGRAAQGRRAADGRPSATSSTYSVRSRELGAAERTGVAIARALVGLGDRHACSWSTSRRPSLPREEVAMLFAALERVRRAGLGVIYVSHRLDEIFAIGDRVTVLQDGVRVGTWNVADIDQDELVRSMIGGEQLRPPHDRAARAGHRRHPSTSRGLGGTVVDNVDLEARRGEVVGIAGLTGSGREEILPLLFGARCREPAMSELDGRPVPAHPRGAVRAGLALVPADRRGHGAVLGYDGPRELQPHEPAAVLDAARLPEPHAGEPTRPKRGSTGSTCVPRAPTRSSACSPAATSRRSCWRSGSADGRRCSCSTSPARGSTSAPRPSSTHLPGRLPRMAPASSSRPPTTPSSATPAIAFS